MYLCEYRSMFWGGWMDECMKANIVKESEESDQTVCSAYSYNFFYSTAIIVAFFVFFFISAT
jgi:hypothetical protein